MSTSTLIPVEQYLSTVYKPDCDYVDGEVEERSVGEQSHNLVQTMLASIFVQHRRQWGFRPIAEQRIQVLPTRFRVPDVCLVPAWDEVDEILHHPPALCIEILSQEDRFGRVLAKVEDYLQFGVPCVWIIDPRTREVWTVGPDGKPSAFTGDRLSLEGTQVSIQVAEIFSLIDEAGQRFANG